MRQGLSRWVWLLPALLISAGVHAQQTAGLMSQLAEEVCACIDNPKRQTLAGRPGKCLKRVAGQRRAGIATAFQLDVSSADDYQELIDSLVPYLATDCTVLADYQLAREAVYSWSDAPTERGFRYEAAVIGSDRLPDGPVLTERLQTLSVTGVLAEVAEDQLLITAQDDKYSFYLPSRVANPTTLSPGQVYTLTARWQIVKDRNAFAYVITRLSKQ